MARKEILVVEDDLDTRAALSTLLETAGYTVRAAADGKEALGVLRDDPRIGLILLDVEMPTMDGFEFRRRQKQDKSLAGIPVFVVTGTDASVEALDPVTVLRKPIDVDRLLRFVGAHYLTDASREGTTGHFA